MATGPKVGGVWRTLLEPKPKVGGSWRTGVALYQKVAGVWELAWQPASVTLALSNITVSKDAGPQFALMEFEVRRNGDLAVEGTVRANEWVLDGEEETTLGDAYELRVTQTGGTLLLSGITDGVWTDLNVDRTMSAGSTSGGLNYTGTIEIREKANTLNIVSATVSLSTT